MKKDLKSEEYCEKTGQRKGTFPTTKTLYYRVTRKQRKVTT